MSKILNEFIAREIKKEAGYIEEYLTIWANILNRVNKTIDAPLTNWLMNYFPSFDALHEIMVEYARDVSKNHEINITQEEIEALKRLGLKTCIYENYGKVNAQDFIQKLQGYSMKVPIILYDIDTGAHEKVANILQADTPEYPVVLDAGEYNTITLKDLYKCLKKINPKRYIIVRYSNGLLREYYDAKVEKDNITIYTFATPQ